MTWMKGGSAYSILFLLSLRTSSSMPPETISLQRRKENGTTTTRNPAFTFQPIPPKQRTRIQKLTNYLDKNKQKQIF